MLSDERGRRGSLGRVMASYRQPGCSLDGHSAKWDFRKHQLCLCYHFCGMWLNILKEYLRFNLNLNLNNWMEPRFFLFSLRMQNCLPFLRLSIAIVLWMAHPAGECRQRLFYWKCAFIVCDFSFALQIKFQIWLSKFYQNLISAQLPLQFPWL